VTNIIIHLTQQQGTMGVGVVDESILDDVDTARWGQSQSQSQG